MKKEDLENGMIVELRNGVRYLILDYALYTWDNVTSLKMLYKNDLTHLYTKEEDIMYVYDVRNCLGLDCLFDTDQLRILWERPTIKLSENDINTLKCVINDYYYIARDADGGLFIYEDKPVKNKDIDKWVNIKDSYYFCCDMLNLSCENIKWTDEEPFNFREYLNNLEKE